MVEIQDDYQRVIRRHHLEKKQLQAEIQTMKNSIPKNDKKERKQMLLKVARLKAELEQRHQIDLEKFQDYLEHTSVESMRMHMSKMNLENLPPRSLKAQKRREKRVALRAHPAKVAQWQTDPLSVFRREEHEKVVAILRSKNLVMKTILADGHCMYRAILDQLAISVTVETLRYRTACYMQKHIEEFLPFFSEEEGTLCTREDFLKYCEDIVFRSAWGGQLELRAVSHVFKTPIEVIQANSPIVVLGEEYYHRKPLTLVYLHYACDFAEHYNSVMPIGSTSSVAGQGPAPRLF